MMRSLYSAITGLKNHQTKMDVIGNNIANVNTTGFKRSSVDFATALSQTLKGASSPTPSQGGTNPMQVGLGSMIGAINQIMTQGSAQTTGNPTDMMLQGSGFFVLNNNGQQVFTRNGAFAQDSNGNLVDPATGAKVQGYSWGTDDSTVPNWGAAGDIKFKLGDTLASDTGFPIPDTPTANSSPLLLNTFSSTGPYNLGVNNAENVTIDGMTRVATGTTPAAGQFTYDPANGDITFATGFDPSAAAATVQIHYVDHPDLSGSGSTTNKSYEHADSATQVTADYPPVSGAPVYIDGNKYTLSTSDTPGDGEYTVKTVNGKYQITFGAKSAVDATTGSSTSTDATTATAISYDFTNKAHTLSSFNIDQSGVITGVYSNGTDTVTHKIAQIEVATFANDAGLQNIGGSFYTQSNNSGTASIGAAGDAGRGSIVSGSLEMSNVDLSQEMTDMITAQRGFQANSRVITVSDTLLQELIDLKRQ